MATISCEPNDLSKNASCLVGCLQGMEMDVLISLFCTIANKPTGGGTGTVTTFSAGNLSPLFTTNVANPTTTPALTFAAVNQNANLFFAGPATGAAAAPTFRSLANADFGTGLTPQFARLGLGVAADASLSLYASGPNNGAGVNSFVARFDCTTSNPCITLGDNSNNAGFLMSYSKPSNYGFFGVYGAQGMTLDSSGNMNLTGGVYQCQSNTGLTSSFDGTNTVTVTGGIITGIA